MDANDYINNQREILERLEKLEGSFNGISTIVSRIGIDTQQYVKANDLVVPSVACKVAYDQYGLVRKGDRLDVSDIPSLPIEKIINLKELLNQRTSNRSGPKQGAPMRAAKKIIAGTGTKVNYDEDGRIVSSSNLIPSDIPDLPIEKITGLVDRLKILEDYHDPKDEQPEFRVTPGTFAKISYDSAGRVTKGEKLTLDDIPQELMSRLNIIESGMVSFAPRTLVNTLQESMSKKLDANDYMTPGVYMKVRVDHKGLVTGYEKLQKKDLPQFGISDIEGLDKSLRSKADQASFIELSETVASLSSLPSKISDIPSIKVELSQKASRDDLSAIKTQLTSTNNLLQTLVDKIPNDTIVEFLNSVRGELDAISGRVAVLEQKFSEK